MFFEHPTTRAITLIGIFSDRCNRRISAQSSTSNTRFLLTSNRDSGSGRGSTFGCRQGVSLHVPPTPRAVTPYGLVGWARTTVGRHTWRQVLVGAVVGALVAGVVYLALR
ncbi:MAG: phosphatase PAP2 family protein [Actinomycetales bacterium]|nr:phosphatase PAP2 family protein [Candidatus Lutibacillus vidarii]